MTAEIFRLDKPLECKDEYCMKVDMNSLFPSFKTVDPIFFYQWEDVNKALPKKKKIRKKGNLFLIVLVAEYANYQY